MEERIRRADELARLVASQMATEGLIFAYELQPYQGGCMVHVDLAENDGLTFMVPHSDSLGWIVILDPGDYSLPPTALSQYVLLRARGTQPYEAWEAARKADPNGAW